MSGGLRIDNKLGASNFCKQMNAFWGFCSPDRPFPRGLVEER